MSIQTSPNAISRMLDQLAEEWSQHARMEGIRLCRWKVHTDAYRVIETFAEHESSEGGKTPDIFLRFETPFQFADQYGKELQQTFRSMAHSDREQLQEEGIDMQWKAASPNAGAHGSQFLFQELEAFIQINGLSDSLIVAFLVPKENQDMEAWKVWLSQAMEAGVPPHVRIMLADTWESPVFDGLCEHYSLYAQSIEPELDMEAAMRDLAAMGNPHHPGVQYRMAFVNLTQAAGKQRWGEVDRFAEEALVISQKENWPHLTSTVHMTVAGAQTQAQRYLDAHDRYASALDVAIEGQQDTEGQDESVRKACGRVAIQAIFGQATTQIGMQDYGRAAHLYEIAATYATQFESEEGPSPEEMESQYSIYKLEAWRMAGYCQEAGKQYNEAWDSYEKALEVGRALKAENRQYSTLVYVGEALLRLTQRTGHIDQYYPLQEEFDQMLGEGWENQIATRSRDK